MEKHIFRNSCIYRFFSLALLFIFFISDVRALSYYYTQVFSGNALESDLTVSQVVNKSSIPRGASRVPMLYIAFNNSCQKQVKINSVTLHRQGMGAAEDISAVYLMDGYMRVTEARSVSNGNETVHLRIRKNNVLAPCESKTFTVLADFTKDALGEHRLFILSGQDIEADKNVFLISSGADSQPNLVVPARKQGNVDIEFLNLNRKIYYGKNQTVARFQLKASGEDQIVKAVTFKNIGSAENEDLRNIYLEKNGVRISNISPYLTGDRVRIILNPSFYLEKGDKASLFLKADVLASRRHTIRFGVEEPSDIESYPD